jgi:hypothetical protein
MDTALTSFVDRYNMLLAAVGLLLVLSVPVLLRS